MGRVVPAEVLALIEERQKVENWVAKLADHETDTTPAVFAKVMDDYQSRLGELNSGLAEHHTELQGSLDEHSGLVTGLQAEREERADSLEEAKLRFAVGEFDQPLWDIRREEGESALAELDERLTEEKSAVEELEAVLARMAGEGGESRATLAASLALAAADDMASLEQEPDQELDKEDASSDEVVDVEDLEEEAAEPESAMDEDEVDEIEEDEGADNQDVASAEAEPVAVAGEADTSSEEPLETADLATAEGRGEGFLDELEFLESLSLDEADKFDAVSAMLDEEEQSNGEEEEEQSR